MDYMLTITRDESAPFPAPGEPGFDEARERWADYTRSLIADGFFVNGASLQPSATATTVRKSPNGEPAIVDGPFSESKEQLAGYYVVRVDDLDGALELVRAMPFVGSVEIRPLAMAPDASGTPQPVGSAR